MRKLVANITVDPKIVLGQKFAANRLLKIVRLAVSYGSHTSRTETGTNLRNPPCGMHVYGRPIGRRGASCAATLPFCRARARNLDLEGQRSTLVRVITQYGSTVYIGIAMGGPAL